VAQKRKIDYEPEFTGSFILPSSAGAGKILVSNSEGKAEWKTISIRVPNTYAIGPIVAARKWPFVWASIGTTEEQKIVKMRYSILEGGGVKCELLHNGTAIPGLSVEATTTVANAEPSETIALSENDSIELVTSSTLNEPKYLSLTIFTEHVL